MRFDVVTIFPEFVEALTEAGIMKGARERGVYELHTVNPRDFTEDVHRSVDDRPYGGGPGMLMRPGPVHRAINAAVLAPHTASSEGACGEESEQASEQASKDSASNGRKSRVIYLSPQGRRLDQAVIGELVEESHLVLVAGRYEGVDERVLELCVDDEISIGDYVLAGGELAAMVLIEGCVRQLEGALGNAESLVSESFGSGVGGQLDCAHYTRPAEYEGLSVPAVLLGGDHQQIKEWRRESSLERTRRRRPDLAPECGDKAADGKLEN